MSRASGASFAQFFPSAPRAAKDKAKEREKVKSQHLESPNTLPVADSSVNALTESRAEVATLNQPGDSNTHVTEPATAEDNESLPGDLLNGVGSASSHTSTVSSVFSAPAQNSTMSTGGSRNVNNLTPLTNVDSSPTRVASPVHQKPSAPVTISSEITSEHTSIPPPQAAPADQKPTDLRIPIRDPSKGVKGIICTYDPLLDRTLTSNEKKKAKAVYRKFGMVRITHITWGSVILLVRMFG